MARRLCYSRAVLVPLSVVVVFGSGIAMQSRAARLLVLATPVFAPLTLLSSRAVARQANRILRQGGQLQEFNEGVAAGERAAKLYRPAGDAPVPFEP
jgi:hypothetical protein